MVLTFRAGKFAALAASVAVVLAGVASCSREQQDWRSAEASDTVEAYSDFLKDHPDSGLVRQARARLTQLSEERAWSQAGNVDTLDGYEQFLAQYPNGKWSQEARIRVENFELAAAGTGANAGTGDSSGLAASNIPVAGTASSPSPGGTGASGMSAAPSPGSSGAGPIPAASPPGNTLVGGMPAGPSPGSAVAGGLSAGASGPAPAQPTSARVSVASIQPSGPVAPGEAAQLPTSPSAAAMQSPRPSTYPMAAAAPFPSASAVTPNASGASVSSGVNISAPVGTASAGFAPSASPTPSSMAGAWRSADPTSYGVQLGAFASENAATSQWQQLVERFNAQLRGLAPHVVSAETATGRLFRLQALVADEATARALCDMLRKESQACVPVLPH